VKKIIVACCALLVLAGAAWLFMRSPASPDQPEATARKTPQTALADAVARARSPMAENRKGAPAAKKRRLGHQRISYSDREDLSPVEKRQLTAIQSALDAEDLKALLAVLPEASKSPNAEVRGEMVDALGWFGEEAMLELLPFMADRDEDVAQSAMDSWTMSLSEIENEREKATLVESAMLAIRDEDSLDSMIMELDDCDDLLAMQTVVNLIESPNPKAARVAREHYEFITGEEYAGFDAAEKWMAENYEIEDADGSVSTLAQREAARSRKPASRKSASASRSSSRRGGSTTVTTVTRGGSGSSGEPAGEAGAASGADGSGDGGAAETVAESAIGDDPESTSDAIVGDSNKLLEEEAGSDPDEPVDDGEEGESPAADFPVEPAQ
jgi:hypothetical protein